MTKIMVVDDDPAILDAMQIMLEDEGYDVSISLDGQWIKDMRTDLPDLLFLDIWMSGVDGRVICQQLKAQEHTRQMPIILLSANNETEKIARETGADDFLCKPFDLDDVFALVKKYTR